MHWGTDTSSITDAISIPVATIGGLEIAALDMQQTSALMITLAQRTRRPDRPWIFTSANGEVISRCASSASTRELFQGADVISADGQPLVLASQLRCDQPLPERVATTDLFHEVAAKASGTSLSFYFLGATEDENSVAVDNVRRWHRGVRIAGRQHGFLSERALSEKVKEINEIGPDILWVALGVPREQEFYAKYAEKLRNVGIIKTSGGLFNFLSGTRARAPEWMQAAGLEWAYRISQEPSRLFWRYLTTNPHAAMLLMTRSRRKSRMGMLNFPAR